MDFANRMVDGHPDVRLLFVRHQISESERQLDFSRTSPLPLIAVWILAMLLTLCLKGKMQDLPVSGPDTVVQLGRFKVSAGHEDRWLESKQSPHLISRNAQVDMMNKCFEVRCVGSYRIPMAWHSEGKLASEWVSEENGALLRCYASNNYASNWWGKVTTGYSLNIVFFRRF